MAVMYSFCFWYSVRLGAIIVAFTCLGQCLAALIACGYGLSNLQRTSLDMEYLSEKTQLKMAKAFFQYMRDAPKSSLVGLVSALAIYFCSCISLMYAAFQCNVLYMYPFLILDFIRLVILSFGLVIILMLVKENTLNLGIIIGCSTIGGFTMLYLWYQWLCTVALWEIIREIERLDRSLVKNESIPSLARRESNKLNPFYNNTLYLPKVAF